MNFTLETFHNPHLSAGMNRVDAIITVTASGEAPKTSGAGSSG